jgi:hypothetical protein
MGFHEPLDDGLVLFRQYQLIKAFRPNPDIKDAVIVEGAC